MISNTLWGAGSWKFCDWQKACMLFVFSDTLSCAGSWAFVIDRRRVCSSCFLIGSRPTVPEILWSAIVLIFDRSLKVEVLTSEERLILQDPLADLQNPTRVGTPVPRGGSGGYLKKNRSFSSAKKNRSYILWHPRKKKAFFVGMLESYKFGVGPLSCVRVDCRYPRKPGTSFSWFFWYKIDLRSRCWRHTLS